MLKEQKGDPALETTLVLEVDLANELLRGATEVGFDSLPSDEGKRGVPGGVRSPMTSKEIKFIQHDEHLSAITSSLNYLLNPCQSRANDH